MAADSIVDECISLASIQVNDYVDVALAYGDKANISDAASIWAGAKFGGMLQKKSFEKGNKRCTLTACSLVRDPKIGYYGDASASGGNEAFCQCNDGIVLPLSGRDRTRLSGHISKYRRCSSNIFEAQR